ncbi:MAG: MFS transporter [Proteobacteria bacterium]|nr:MFS transporter [Pseudomonadota bacterium]
MTATEELRRGWPVLIAAFVGIGCGVSSLTLYTGGLFIAPLEHATGWSRAWVAAGSTATTFGVAFFSPAAGWLLDRFGCRATAAASLLGLTAGYVVLGTVPLVLPGYLGTLFAMGLLSSGSSPISFTRAVNASFRRLRGLALGISLAGAGAVGSCAPLVLGPVIADSGWRVGYLSLAAVVALAAAVAFLGLREPADRPSAFSPGGPAKDLGAATGSPVLWILASAFALSASAIAGVVFHFVPILQTHGIARAEAVRAASALGMSVIIGRLFTGAALDRLFGPWVGAVVLLCAAAGCAMLAASNGLPRTAGVMISFAMGTEVDLIAYLLAKYFGLRTYGRVYGILFALVLIAAGLGPLIFGVAYDLTKTYGPALKGAAAMCFTAAVLMLLLPRYPGEVQS